MARITDVVAIQGVREAVADRNGRDGLCHSGLHVGFERGEKAEEGEKEGDDGQGPHVNNHGEGRQQALSRRGTWRGPLLGWLRPRAGACGGAGPVGLLPLTPFLPFSYFLFYFLFYFFGSYACIQVLPTNIYPCGVH